MYLIFMIIPYTNVYVKCDLKIKIYKCIFTNVSVYVIIKPEKNIL